MSNAIFPNLTGLTWDQKKRPTWGTIIQQATSGREVRVTNRALPLFEYELTYSYLQDLTAPSATSPSSNTTTTVAGGSFPAATYYVQTTWITAQGESAPSAESTQAVTASHLLQVSPGGSVPAGATGWNAYVGFWSGGAVKQNATSIAAGSPWTQPAAGLVAGVAPPLAYTDLRALEGFYHQRQGAFDSFLYFDPGDAQATAQAIGTGDGVNTAFQLVSNYGGALLPQQNPIGPVGVFVSGVQQSSGYTLGAPGTSGAGVVTFGAAPGAAAPITATYGYLQRLRFKDDQVEFNEFLSNLWELRTLQLMSVKL